jgi:hypothetical protein
MCRDHVGGDVVDAAPTNVAMVRRTGIGLVGGQFRNAFPRATDGRDFAWWCMVQTRAHCYDEWAVAITGDHVHIDTVGCGWPSGPPRAGPPIWTD